jgi:hypothetical protein
MRTVMIFILFSFIVGCTVPKTREELKHDEASVEGIELEGNYQQILKCWSDNAQRLVMDSSNVTTIEIFEELGEAKIIVPSSFNTYFVLIELKKTSSNRTLVNAYGTGYIGGLKVPEWIAVLKSCQTKRRSNEM